ncbi:hypothetical protein PpBr36_05307, partial [Pyricularia pennisetigena]|uniref:hypothetical protein n=1 Tax=Pyricularia pennisetigena TaxID=1578925 RepID=UPI00114DE210
HLHIKEPFANQNIPQIRAASRQLAREWGFFRSTYADTSLSLAATHCLIEPAEKSVATDAGLRHVLRLDDHTLARATALTTAETVDPAAAATVVSGLQLYATTLHLLRMRQEAAQTASTATVTTSITTQSAQPAPQPAAVTIHAGYRTRLIARAMDMNTVYFSTHHGWGMQFAAGISASLADLLKRLDRPQNQAWTTDLGLPGVAHLRSFITDNSVRGSGAGRTLLAAAMAFVGEVGFEKVRLHTIRQLDAARRLYKMFGFVEVGEVEVHKFGIVFDQLECVWKRPGLRFTD